MGNLEWVHLPGTLRDVSKELWIWRITLCGSSVKRNWREGFLTGDPGGDVEKALETGISLHSGSAGDSEGGFLHQGL